MRVVILAGGMGTRLQEETTTRPKPMVEIGGKPILWHIMKHFAHHQCDDFYIALGYMGDFIKSYFLDQYNLSGNLAIDFATGNIQRTDAAAERWSVNLIDTGSKTLTGGRLLRMKSWLQDGTFMLTYGDGVSNVDLTELLNFHKKQGKLATVTAVRPPARFGGLVIENGTVRHFTEKPVAGEGWINGGFLVFEPGVFDFLVDDQSSLESDALERIADAGELAAYCHSDFWQCMDTLRDKHYLERLWADGSAPWKTWAETPTLRISWPETKAA
ncbi:MAG: glucose-1-phosphate cytidylyltransferase [Planctomycetes bacterium]|nr:glucose-1-phosphate cytidylyltransferase [Planctomycetota bacterium]